MGSKETLENTINQAISDFDSIEAAIKEKGVDVPKGTDTSEYGGLIRAVATYQFNEGYRVGDIDGYGTGYKSCLSHVTDLLNTEV